MYSDIGVASTMTRGIRAVGTSRRTMTLTRLPHDAVRRRRRRRVRRML